MKKTRVLLLGLGFFGKNWIRVLGETADCELVAVSGAREDYEAVCAARPEVASIPCYEDYEQAIKKTDADIVVIVIPTKLHTAAAKLALKKGMHVLSEKPLAMDLQDAVDMLRTKRDYPDLHYVVDQNYRWRPHTLAFRNALRSGIIGKLDNIRMIFSQPEDLVGYRPFLEMPLLQDVCIHHFDLLRYFCDADCKSIFATSFHSPWSKFQGKAATNALIEMKNGVHINYCGTWSGHGKATPWDGVFIAAGDKGELILDDNSEVWFREYGSEAIKLPPAELDHVELAHCLHELMQVIEKGGQHETCLQNNFGSFAMVCAAEASAQQGIHVTLESLCADVSLN